MLLATPSAKPQPRNWASPLDRLAGTSERLIANHDAKFESGAEGYVLPRYVFKGPPGGDDPIRLGLFAGIHGDEPAGTHALVDFLGLLEQQPEIARGYVLFIYPVCNPTGFEDGTRQSRRGKDLNREFWNESAEPEVALLQAELVAHAFSGLIALHSDDTSDGLYGYANGALFSQSLIEPALRAAEEFLPRNVSRVIDGFPARNGVIRGGFAGVLRALPSLRPKPFDIILETPSHADQFRQQKAFVAALLSILAEYRKFMAYAPNL